MVYRKTRKNTQRRSLRVTKASQYRDVERMIRKGPLTIILVHSPSCGHCVRYMPMWDKLTNIKNKNSNMIKMKADAFSKTPLSEKVSISGVPSVLFVSPSGEISVADDHTDMESMTETVSSGTVSSSPVSESPSTFSSPNPLQPIPGYVTQSGGNPWQAFLAASLRS